MSGMDAEREHDDDAAGAGGDGKGEGIEGFLLEPVDLSRVMAGAAAWAASVFSWLGVLSCWFRSDQPIMAMTIPPETCMIDREMPKKPRRDEPTSSMMAKKMTVLIAIFRARER